MTKRGRPRNKLYDKMWLSYQDGLSCQDIGDLLGVSRQAVVKAFKLRGKQLRPKDSWYKNINKKP